MMYKVISINSNALFNSLSSNLSSEDTLLQTWVKAPYCETSKQLSALPSKSTDNPLQLGFEDNKAQILRFLEKLDHKRPLDLNVSFSHLVNLLCEKIKK